MQPCCGYAETWRPIPGVVDYEASNLGGIRRIRGGQGSQAGKVLKYRPQVWLGEGLPEYLRPRQRKNGGRFMVVWERAVCAAAHGEPPLPAFIVHHKDENRTHKCAENLEWSSVSRHVRHHRREHA